MSGERKEDGPSTPLGLGGEVRSPRAESRGLRVLVPRTRRGRAGLATFLLLATLAGILFSRSLQSGLLGKRPSHVLLDRAGRFLGEIPGSDEAYGYWPLPRELPEKIVITTLETEDRHFHEHAGVHLPSIARALWQDVRHLKVISGASTVPMQVARMQHPASRTPWAKLREAAEALLLVDRHGKDAVLRQYLTLAPYGNRCHGVVRAARLYFDKPAEDVSWLQAAFLAALPQQPSRMSPWTVEGHARALRRAKRILTQLHARGIVSDEDFRVALQSDLRLLPHPKRHKETVHALLAFAERLPKDGGVVHTTTLDLDVQRVAADAVTTNLARWKDAGAGNAAMLVVDLPTGDVLAYVGSADYFDEEHKGAIDFLDTKRSPGSSLKPFVYGLALERRTHTAATELPDTPVEFAIAGGGAYVPENITHTFLGPMLLRQALGNSRNIPALRVLSDVGVDRAVDLFQRGGVQGLSFTPEAYGLSLAIGSMPVTPWELATLYTALGNEGVTVPLRRFASEPVAKGARLFGADAAALLSHILADPEARRPGFPSGGPLDFDYAVGVKTGTSQGYRDAWATAYSDRLLVVSWLGNHDWRRMNLASGATAAAPALHQVMDAVMPTRAPHKPWAMSFPAPAHAVSVEICALSGRLPGPSCTHTKTEVFIPGTEPHEHCPFHVDVKLDTRNGLLAGPSCPKDFVATRSMLALSRTYEPWARSQRLAIAPTEPSPLCPSEAPRPRHVAIREPRSHSRYLYDPDTPREYSTVRLSAQVSPATEDVVWLVDGTPVGKVSWPHELRWNLSPGTHTIRAALAHGGEASAPVTVVVDD